MGVSEKIVHTPKSKLIVIFFEQFKKKYCEAYCEIRLKIFENNFSLLKL